MPITVRKSSDRGSANHGWLNTKHTFSFASYYDPRFESFGPLRVINEDRVAGGTGFGTHGHANAEIYSYVVSGKLEHRDSMGNREVLSRGDVQFTSAGSGIRHSEYNGDKKAPVHFLQIWVTPERRNLKPRYDTKTFADADKTGKLKLLVSKGGEDGSIAINQDISTYASLLDNDAEVEHKFAEGRAGYIHVVETEGSGGVVLNSETKLKPGDGAFVTDLGSLAIKGVAEEGSKAELLLFDLKAPESATHKL